MSILHGYALAEALDKDAEDCAREDRAALLRQAAREIRDLIQQVRAEMDKVNALKEWGEIR